jgi:hypothetical protein
MNTMPKKARKKRSTRSRSNGIPPTETDIPGRKTDYTVEMAHYICGEIAAGVSIKSLSTRDGMPSRSTIYKWLDENDEFSKLMDSARKQCAHTLVEEMLEIADDGTNDYMMRQQENGAVMVVDHEHIQRSRLRCEARKWIASKFFPRAYGEKLALNGGENEDGTAQPVTVNLVRFSGTPINKPGSVGGGAQRPAT